MVWLGNLQVGPRLINFAIFGWETFKLDPGSLVLPQVEAFVPGWVVSSGKTMFVVGEGGMGGALACHRMLSLLRPTSGPRDVVVGGCLGLSFMGEEFAIFHRVGLRFSPGRICDHRHRGLRSFTHGQGGCDLSPLGFAIFHPTDMEFVLRSSSTFVVPQGVAGGPKPVRARSVGGHKAGGVVVEKAQGIPFRHPVKLTRSGYPCSPVQGILFKAGMLLAAPGGKPSGAWRVVERGERNVRGSLCCRCAATVSQVGC